MRFTLARRLSLARTTVHGATSVWVFSSISSRFLCVVVPLRQRGDIHVGKLPAFQRAVATVMEALDLRFAADIKPELEQMNTLMDQHLFEAWCFLEKALVLFRGAEAHDRLHPGAVIP